MARSPRTKPRVIVDANVLVSGRAWPRWPYEVLQHALDGDYHLVYSAQIVDEARLSITKFGQPYIDYLEDFLAECHYEKAPLIADEDIAANVLEIRDPKDVHVALSALAAGVDCLVTHDKDLTENDALTQQVHVVLPAVFLRDYMGWTSERLETIRSRTWKDVDS
jgi:putative PIN family toxin of toxin-antitoxin system